MHHSLRAVMRVNPEDQSRYWDNLVKIVRLGFWGDQLGEKPHRFPGFGETLSPSDISHTLSFKHRVLMMPSQNL